MNSNSQNNAYTCLGYVNQALLSLQNNGEMTPPESQYIAQYINSSPANREQFCQSVYTTFGESPATNDQLWNFTVNKMRSALVKLRQNRASAMPQYGYQNNAFGNPCMTQFGMGMQQQQMNGWNSWQQQPVMQQQQGFGYQPQAQYGQNQMQAELNSIYGGNSAPNPTYSTTPVQNPTNAVQQNPTPKQVQADTCTHQPYDTSCVEETEMVSVGPRYRKMALDEIPVNKKPIETTDKNGEVIRKKPLLDEEELVDVHSANEPLWGEWYEADDDMSDTTVKLSEAELPGVQDSAEDALVALTDSSNDEVFMGKYAYVVSYNEAVALESDYEKGVGYWNMCNKAFRSNKGPKGVLALFKQIEQLPIKLNTSLSKLIVEEWNKNAEINFVRSNVDGSITRIGTCESLADIRMFLIDEPSNQLADWKVDQKAYMKSLQSTIDGSIGRIFHTKKFKYLDPSNKLDKCFIIEAAKSKLKVGNQKLSTLMFVNPTDSKTVGVVNAAVRNVFVVLVERRVLVTNVKFLEEYDSNKSEILSTENVEGKIISSLARKRGNFTIVDPTKEETISHPNYSGWMYDNRVLIRRKI